VRVLSATNARLAERLELGSFRRDLYFRLARYTVEAPPLRERREDIPLLARHFVRLFAKEMGRPIPALSAALEENLTRYDFPGNVRELKNITERAMIESRGGEIRLEHLHLPATEPRPAANGSTPSRRSAVDRDPGIADGSTAPLDLDGAAHQAERRVIEEAIARCDGNVTEAARMLKTSRNRIYRVLGGTRPGRSAGAKTGDAA
jgi:two-component system response regulator AtoC